MVFRCWERKPTRDEAALIITDTHDPPMVEDEIRETFRSIVSDLSDFKHRVARLELPRARKWATAGGLDLSLDEEGLATLLTIDGFTIGPGRLTVWLGEGAQIFAGHLLEVRIERGEIIEVCLAG